MKRILLVMAGVSALAAAAPAMAQYDRYGSTDVRTEQLRDRINDDIRRGLVRRDEGYRLLNEISQLRRLQDQYRSGGYSARERQELDRRFESVANRVSYAERGRYGDDRYGTYDRGYGGTYGTYGNGYGTPGGTYDPYPGGNYGYGGTYDPYPGTDTYGYGYGYDYDRNNDGYDDRDYDRDGRYDDDVSGYDSGVYDNDGYGNGAYDDDRYDNDAYDVPGPDTYYDGGSPGYVAPGAVDRGDLRIGQRAPANLSPVPPEFRNLYPDGNGVYYRYDDGRVFQIDTATNTIRWIGEISD